MKIFSVLLLVLVANIVKASEATFDCSHYSGPGYCRSDSQCWWDVVRRNCIDKALLGCARYEGYLACGSDGRCQWNGYERQCIERKNPLEE